MAAGGAGAAARADAADRRADVYCRGRSGRTARIAAFLQGLAATGLDRRTQRAGRLSAGPRAMPSAFADLRRNWSRSRRTLSWPLAPPSWWPLQQATRTVPIVFVTVVDPVGGAWSRAWRGRAATLPASRVRVWAEREMPGAAQADRASRDAGRGHPGSRRRLRQRGLRHDRGRGPAFRVELIPATCATRREIERGIATFARAPNGGLIVPGPHWRHVHRDLIITLAARHKLPAVYSSASSSSAAA